MQPAPHPILQVVWLPPWSWNKSFFESRAVKCQYCSVHTKSSGLVSLKKWFPTVCWSFNYSLVRIGLHLFHWLCLLDADAVLSRKHASFMLWYSVGAISVLVWLKISWFLFVCCCFFSKSFQPALYSPLKIIWLLCKILLIDKFSGINSNHNNY